MEPIVYILIGALACLGLLYLVQQVTGQRRQHGSTDDAVAAMLLRLLVEAEGTARGRPTRRGRRARWWRLGKRGLQRWGGGPAH